MTFLYCNGCKSIICYPAFYLKLAVACTTEYVMIYGGQGNQWCDWYLAQHNWLRADGQSRFSVRAIQGGCKQQIVGKARPCSAWYNLFCWTLMQFFILTKISKKNPKTFHFSEKTLIDVCRRRNDVLWEPFANHHICNVLSFNTIFTNTIYNTIIQYLQNQGQGMLLFMFNNLDEICNNTFPWRQSVTCPS